MANRQNGRRFWPSLESLESRLTPVVGANAVPPAVVPGGAYDAVVQLTTPASLGTGTLFRTGQGEGFGTHILTAAHNLDGGPLDVTFHLARDGNAIPIAIHLPAGAPFQVPHQGYAGGQNDIAILRLTDQEPGFQQGDRLLVAPFGAQPFRLYNAADEVGQDFVFVGYGRAGMGLTGDTLPSGTKRSGNNHFDADGTILGRDATTLQFDFDNGLPANDAYGLLAGIPDLGLGNAESLGAPGDSGGPALIGNRLAGVMRTSGTVTGQALTEPPLTLIRTQPRTIVHSARQGRSPVFHSILLGSTPQ